jgi:hypothetical protein
MKNGNDDLYCGGQKSLSRLLGLVNSTRLVPRIEMDDDPPEAGDWVGFRRKVKEGGEIVAIHTFFFEFICDEEDDRKALMRSLRRGDILKGGPRSGAKRIRVLGRLLPMHIFDYHALIRAGEIQHVDPCDVAIVTVARWLRNYRDCVRH